MTTEQQQTAALETEAGELQQDIKEAKTEAAAERVAGNDARADKLEASIAEAKSDLAEIKATLAEIKGRPYAPAPGDEEAAPDGQGRTGDGAAEKTAAAEGQGDGQAAAETEGKPRKKHWFYGDRFNQD
jgi:hypothetical protein